MPGTVRGFRVGVNGDRGSIWEEENVLRMDGGDDCIGIQIDVHFIFLAVHLKTLSQAWWCMSATSALRGAEVEGL